jgi:uncharacterized protein (TIGR02996 family)
MTHEEAFLADILGHPGEDAPRLIFADWLDERGGEGDAERAEFVRVQCELARADLAEDSYPSFGHGPASAGGVCPVCGHVEHLRARERDLLAHLCILLPRETPFGTRCVLTLDARVHGEESSLPVLTLRRGFVEAAMLSVNDYLDHAEALHAAAPLREVMLTADDWAAATLLTALLQQDLVGRLHTLDLSRVAVRPSVWVRAFRQACRPWRGLRRLVLPTHLTTRLEETRGALPGVEVRVVQRVPAGEAAPSPWL